VHKHCRRPSFSEIVSKPLPPPFPFCSSSALSTWIAHQGQTVLGRNPMLRDDL
jgi:hypothetical protein